MLHRYRLSELQAASFAKLVAVPLDQSKPMSATSEDSGSRERPSAEQNSLRVTDEHEHEPKESASSEGDSGERTLGRPTRGVSPVYKKPVAKQYSGESAIAPIGSKIGNFSWQSATNTVAEGLGLPGFSNKSPFKDYVYEKVLGSGAFSKVRLGIHVPTQTKVAVKIMSKARLEVCRERQLKQKLKLKLITQDQYEELKEEALTTWERLSKEAKLLQYLDHPNIIVLYQVAESATEFHIIQEYAPGGTLPGYMKSRGGKLSEETSRVIFRQLLSALDHCHRSGVVHRDIKMDNVLLRDADADVPHAMLTDFGLGRIIDPEDMCATFCGTPIYAAPELVSGVRYHGSVTDIWALMVLLFQLIAGRAPFKAKGVPNLYKKILAVDYIMPEQFSPELQELIQGVFKRDSADRLEMEELRIREWTNKGFDTPPARVLPHKAINQMSMNFMDNCKSIAYEKDAIIYLYNNPSGIKDYIKSGFDAGKPSALGVENQSTLSTSLSSELLDTQDSNQSKPRMRLPTFSEEEAEADALVKAPGDILGTSLSVLDELSQPKFTIARSKSEISQNSDEAKSSGTLGQRHSIDDKDLPHVQRRANSERPKSRTRPVSMSESGNALQKIAPFRCAYKCTHLNPEQLFLKLKRILTHLSMTFSVNTGTMMSLRATHLGDHGVVESPGPIENMSEMLKSLTNSKNPPANSGLREALVMDLTVGKVWMSTTTTALQIRKVSGREDVFRQIHDRIVALCDN
eukprot:Clim_evm62s149 gene=Clim_evmTU62s149